MFFQDKKYTTTHQQIMEQAVLCLSKKGFYGTTVNSIANHCGLSGEEFYHCFSSKIKLVHAVVNDILYHCRHEIFKPIDELKGVDYFDAHIEKISNYFQTCYLYHHVMMILGHELRHSRFSQTYRCIESYIKEWKVTFYNTLAPFFHESELKRIVRRNFSQLIGELTIGFILDDKDVVNDAINQSLSNLIQQVEIANYPAKCFYIEEDTLLKDYSTASGKRKNLGKSN